jgi:ABC-type Fe3+ transport system permease subunit
MIFSTVISVFYLFMMCTPKMISSLLQWLQDSVGMACGIHGLSFVYTVWKVHIKEKCYFKTIR